MAKLVCRALRCVEETDEAGSDDPYMIIFRGSFTLPPDVKVVGGKDSAWASMSTGDLRIVDMVLDEPYRTDSTYLIVMLEQDWNKDILTDGSWGKVAEIWANYWHKLDPGIAATSALVIGGALDNDELLSTMVKLPPILQEGGTGSLYHFSGDGGHYRARFVKRA